MVKILICIILAYFLDLIFGDPRFLYHPIVFIGKTISFFEKKLYNAKDSNKTKYIKGIALCFFVLTTTGITFSIILYTAYKLNINIFSYKSINITLFDIVYTFLSYQILASKSLWQESMKVKKTFDDKKSIDESRFALSMIVGRDTKDLDKDAILRATVETVGENTSDGVIAPLIYLVIGGPILALLYKGINTLDSMVGYKNDKYLYFGRFSAIFDDVVNFVPARITGILMIISSFVLGYNYKNAIKIFRRDRKKHSSPNSAHGESVCAGALDIRLLGPSTYFGKVVYKDFIGDNNRPIEPMDIKRANKLMVCSGLLFVFMLGIIGLIGTFI